MAALTAPQELHDLAFRYGLAVDTLDADGLIALFTADGVVAGYGDNPIDFRGSAGLRRMIGQVDQAFQRTMHNVFNQTFERDDAGKVRGIATCIASHILHADPDVTNLTLMDMAIRYHSEYVQDEGVWMFSARRLEVLWVETRPVQKFNPAMMDSDLKEFR
jgi:hypothetical protein